MKIEIVNPQFKCNNPAELLEKLGIAWVGKTHETISMMTDEYGTLTIDNLPEALAPQVNAFFDPAATVVALQAKITTMEATLKSANLI